MHAACKYGHLSVIDYLTTIHTNLDLQDKVNLIIFYLFFYFIAWLLLLPRLPPHFLLLYLFFYVLLSRCTVISNWEFHLEMVGLIEDVLVLKQLVYLLWFMKSGETISIFFSIFITVDLCLRTEVPLTFFYSRWSQNFMSPNHQKLSKIAKTLLTKGLQLKIDQKIHAKTLYV